MLGHKYCFVLICLSLVNVFRYDCSSIILFISPGTLVSYGEITATLVMLSIVSFTAFNPALASHPYSTAAIHVFLDSGGLERHFH
ncbi:hypothetical protein K505DRAFT_92253 [Melanomma pulvis-pyrius CBS 109.77]|uniref:Uncharacterized protein n=1 Tax=Melanomma pulvis-pyrius CBS 109.77 TaxID=1314802 RepID=A0A6A6XS36_9PLEO|nr:hypothetical protein K505DRAFT_92253 [Melanomma pulvis-pyrius CBS 109.77]